MHRMIEIHSKYDNVHINVMFYALNCINNHVLSCLDCMLSSNTLKSILLAFFEIVLKVIQVFSL